MAAVVLVDLSSILHREFAIHQQDGDVNATAHQVVDKVRRIAAGQPHVAICCDSGRSFRKDISPEYKLQRKERDPSLYHQQAIVIDKLKADGFPIWSVKEYEADDLLATAAILALQHSHDTDVLLVTTDKDMYQLIGERVSLKRADTGDVIDDAAVKARFGVWPYQMGDLLALTGDTSDNITGAHGIGEKTAAGFLEKFGTLADMHAAIVDAIGEAGLESLSNVCMAPLLNTATGRKKRCKACAICREQDPICEALRPLGITPAHALSLGEFLPRSGVAKQLVTLRADAPIPFDEVFAPRVSKAAAEYDPEADYPADEDPMTENEQQGPQAAVETTQAVTGTIEPAETPAPATEAPKPAAAPVVAMVPRVVDAELVPYERALDPRSMQDARILAKDLYQAAMFSGYGSPPAILTTVMLGRELGLPAMASLRGIHNIEGKHALSAQTMVALCLKSGQFDYFERISSSATEATYEAMRKGARSPQRVTYTIDQARQAGLIKDKSAWSKDPESMLIARASSRLARIVAPDIVGGLLTPDEVREARDTEALAS
jgi:5'-3' exonuclease